jgi:hypothetical protein
MSCRRRGVFYKISRLSALRKITSLVLAFSFAVSSPLSLAVAYAQTSSESATPSDISASLPVPAAGDGQVTTPEIPKLDTSVLEAAIGATQNTQIPAPTLPQTPTQSDSAQAPAGDTPADTSATTPDAASTPAPTDQKKPSTPPTPSSSSPSSNSYPDLLKYPLKPTPDASGGLSLQYPIGIPPGRGSMTPRGERGLI